jgi:hypothetical protein
MLSARRSIIDVFGFEILDYFGEPAVYAMVARDACEVHFGKGDSDATYSNETIRRVAGDFMMLTPEIDLLFAEFKARKALIVQAISERSYGREFSVRDCDGHLIWVVS